MPLPFLSLSCSTASVTERCGGSSRGKQTPLLKGDCITGVTSNEHQSLHYCLKTGNNLTSEILVGAQNKYYKLVYTQTMQEQKTSPKSERPENKNLSCQRAPHFPYLLIKHFTNSTTWLGTLEHLPKPQDMQWVTGEETLHIQDLSIPFCYLLTHHQHLLQRENTAGCENVHTHNTLLIRDSELQKYTSRVYKAKYHTFFHITAIVLWTPECQVCCCHYIPK